MSLLSACAMYVTGSCVALPAASIWTVPWSMKMPAASLVRAHYTCSKFKPHFDVWPEMYQQHMTACVIIYFNLLCSAGTGRKSLSSAAGRGNAISSNRGYTLLSPMPFSLQDHEFVSAGRNECLYRLNKMWLWQDKTLCLDSLMVCASFLQSSGLLDHEMRKLKT